MNYELRRKRRVPEIALLVAMWCTFFPMPGPATFLVWRFQVLCEYPWILAMTGISTVIGLALAFYVISVLRTVRREGIILSRIDKVSLWLELIFGFLPMLFWIYFWTLCGIAIWLITRPAST